MQKITLTILFFIVCELSFGQVPIFEKEHNISRKAKKGYLGNVAADNEKMTFDMSFVLPSSASKIKVETYTFDKELNLINTQKEEEEIERVRAKYSWIKFRGETYSVNLLTASANLTNKLVFRKKEITYSWSWWQGAYTRNARMLEKVKPKSEETGEKYMFFGGSYENESTSNLLVLAAVQAKNSSAGYQMTYDVLSCDANVNINKVTSIKFDYPNMPVFSSPLISSSNSTADEAAQNGSDWIVVFAPSEGKKNDPSPRNYTYVRMNGKGEVVEKFNFNSPANGWRIAVAYDQEGSVTLAGAAIIDRPDKKLISKIFPMGTVAKTSADLEEKKLSQNTNNPFAAVAGANSVLTQEELDFQLDNLKYTNFEVGRVKDGKMSFMACPNLETFDKLKAKPIDQKKYVEFDGKRFDIFSGHMEKKGDFFITGQDFNLDKMGKNKGTRLYRGVYVFHFSNTGDLIKDYGIEVDQKKARGFMSSGPQPGQLPTYTLLQQSADGNNEYVFMFYVKKFDEFTPLRSVEYGSIDLKKNELSEFKSLGEDNNRKFYLFRNNQPTQVQLGQYKIFLSETFSGDKINLSRFDLSK